MFLSGGRVIAAAVLLRARTGIIVATAIAISSVAFASAEIAVPAVIFSVATKTVFIAVEFFSVFIVTEFSVAAIFIVFAFFPETENGEDFGFEFLPNGRVFFLFGNGRRLDDEFVAASRVRIGLRVAAVRIVRTGQAPALRVSGGGVFPRDGGVAALFSRAAEFFILVVAVDEFSGERFFDVAWIFNDSGAGGFVAVAISASTGVSAAQAVALLFFGGFFVSVHGFRFGFDRAEREHVAV